MANDDMFEEMYNRLLDFHKRLLELSTDIFWLEYGEEKELLTDDDSRRLKKSLEEEKKLKEDSAALIKEIQNCYIYEFTEKLNEIIRWHEKIISSIEPEVQEHDEYTVDLDLSRHMKNELNILINRKPSEINLAWVINTAVIFMRKHGISDYSN